jgi:ribosome-associated heat shock protein Hsp15
MGRAEDDDDPGGDDGETAGSGAGDRLRVDRWLWCVRLFKSRSQASAAVSGGRVHVNGERVKPARALRVGDHLAVSQGGRDLELDVRAIPTRRGPAPEARACYQETPQSVARGQRWQEQQRLAALTVSRPDRKPDKKERRELDELARRQGRE